MTDEPDYEPRYLAGIVLFNERDFFSAHEVWEDLWNDCGDADRRFYQALIQAAVALYHYGQGNLRGAVKLFASSKAYMDRYPSPHLGLDCDALLADRWRPASPRSMRRRICSGAILRPDAGADPDDRAGPAAGSSGRIPRNVSGQRTKVTFRRRAMNDDQNALANFAGTARLFPLPNLVLFPHVVQPLHVFEPRYRQMTADALAGDRLVAPILLRPGWEESIRRPAGDLSGRVPRPGGRRSAAARRSVQPAGPRHLARMKVHGEVADDRAVSHGPRGAVDRRPAAVAAGSQGAADSSWPTRCCRGSRPATPRDQLRELFRGELPLGALCDILGFALPFPVEHKQALLEQLDVTRRAGRLLTLLDALVPNPPVEVDPDRKFPPDFSAN